MQLLQQLRDYFPTSIFTGSSLIFISEESRVEITEHTEEDFATGQQQIFLRVRLFDKDLDGQFHPGHYEDFRLPTISEMASEIEKFVQFAVGKNLKE